METRNVKISLETATRWHNGTDNELKELAVQTYPELAKKELLKSFEELDKISGYYISTYSELYNSTGMNVERNHNTFATENQAKSSIAMAKLSQVMAVYNDGWVADWSKDSENKYCLYMVRNKIILQRLTIEKRFLAFKSNEIAEEFLANFREDIETYFNY